MNEFWQMVCDPAHWAFELLVSILFDVVLGIFLWPMIRSCWQARKIAKELGARAAYTNYLMGEIGLCRSCHTLPTRLDTSVDLCTNCGDVQVPDRK